MGNLQRLLRIGLNLAFNPAHIVENAADAARRTAIFIICLLAAGLVLLPAIGCAAVGLWIFVQNELGPVWAAFITAAAFLVLAAIIVLVGIITSKRRAADRARPEERSRQINVVTAAVPAALAATMEPKQIVAASRAFFNRYKGTALLTAVVIGLVMGQDVLRPNLRHKSPR